MVIVESLRMARLKGFYPIKGIQNCVLFFRVEKYPFGIGNIHFQSVGVLCSIFMYLKTNFEQVIFS